MKKTEINYLIDYLDYLYPNPRCELNYNKDYELLIATMLSAQTTDKRVNSVTSVLFKVYPTLEDLSKADVYDIEKIIKPIGTYARKAIYTKKIAISLLENCGGIVPNNREYLESLAGVGRKTTNVVLSNIYNVPCVAVDTHVERVSKRLKLANINDDVFTVEKKLNKLFPVNKLVRLHQQLVLFGRYHCKAIKPECTNCKLKEFCIEYKKKN